MPQKPLVAIACGGTGGHLFPGLAVANALVQRGCEVVLIVSPKDVDQQAVKCVHGLSVLTLPAAGLMRGQVGKAALGLLKSFRAARKFFAERPPQAVLAMGGFTSVAPVIAGKMSGAATFLHESNTVPGKANRWLSHIIDQAFIGFPSAANRMAARNVLNTGTPVRPQFEPGETAAARRALGLDATRPVLLVMGGSQGAAGINELILQGLPALLTAAPDLQILHLTGEKEFTRVRETYLRHQCPAVVRPFLTEMELAMAAATLAVCRAGASSLAELAAMRLPAVLVPYPTAADNHQFYNARALTDAGAAWLMEQRDTSPEKLAGMIAKLYRDELVLTRVREELVRWHSPRAAEQMAEKMLQWLRQTGMIAAPAPAGGRAGTTGTDSSFSTSSDPSSLPA